MDRIVHDLATERKSERSRSRYFSEYTKRANIVLLGDPGAGKSHLFRTYAAIDGGRYETVRTFLTTPVRRHGETLFLDALDERRAGRGDRDTVDALVVKLFETAPTKIRLSCRIADWLGESDLAALRPMFEQSGGEPTVLALAALSEDERRALLMSNGLQQSDAEDFLREAERHGLGEFLDNPQNLLMLLGSVQVGLWPATRRELFELSTKLMLQEANADHARYGAGVYSVDELRPVAGAILATRLISDVEAVSLSDQEGSEGVPSYRSFSFFDRDLVRAVLARRVFIAAAIPESVDYGHRVVAEYLGAAWLADAVRGGLPFTRLQALLGVDGHPAPELRGLHAWLPIHLPEHAGRIIDSDPYGVLTYGDAASLTPSNCTHLLRALGRLSQADPWFRSEKWKAPAIGALSRSDMIDEFRSVMRSDEAGFGIRSIVVEALAFGSPQPELKDDLAAVLVRSKSTYSERYHSALALSRLDKPGKDALIEVYHNRLGERADDLRLSVHILLSLYGEPFGPSDVISLVQKIWLCSEELPTGVLWILAKRIPSNDVSAILDGIEHRARKTKTGRRNAWEIAYCHGQLLVRAWEQLTEIEPKKALNWLRVQEKFRDEYHGDQENLRAALNARPDRLSGILDHFLETIVIREDRWLDLFSFRESTMNVFTPSMMLDKILDHLSRTQTGSAKQTFLYEAAFPFLWLAPSSHASYVFERLYTLGETAEAMGEVREASVVRKLAERYLERRIKLKEHQTKEQEDKESLRFRFAADREIILKGEHLGWLRILARIYLGIGRDTDATQTPRQRLATFFGESNVATALAGLVVVLDRTDLPTLKDVVSLVEKRRLYEWWYAILVAMEERFATSGDVSEFSDELLAAAFAFELTVVIPKMRDGIEGRRSFNWIDAAIAKRPALARDAYVTIARVRFSNGDEHIEGLRELLTIEALAPYRSSTALKLLRDFPNAKLYRLREMLDCALATPEAHAELLALATLVISGAVHVNTPQRDQWLAAAYLLGPAEFRGEIEYVANQRPGIIFDLREFTLGESGGPRGPITPTLPQVQFVAVLTGTLHPNSTHPTSGWTGNTNPWDASEYFDSLVNTISANPSDEATIALSRLTANPALTSYRDFLLNATARQLARRREKTYQRPDWQHTVDALTNGPPATVADLHALLVAHLKDFGARVATVNTDLFKVFWNIDRHARPTTPRPEEACRDTLIDLLRPGLAPLGISVEPEGHMARDKRADISVAMPRRKILCELKRDYHRDVWIAMETQLERFYAHDPDAGGFGVYLVFWFGRSRPRLIPAPPGRHKRPNLASEMALMLRAQIPKNRTSRIATVVIDVSGDTSEPILPKPRRSKGKRSTGTKAHGAKTGKRKPKTKSQQRVRKVSSGKERTVVRKKRAL